MSTVAKEIDEIIRQRQSRLPKVESIRKQCADLRDPLNEVEMALEELFLLSVDNKDLEDACLECRIGMQRLRNDFEELEKDILLNMGRFRRKTINIGFAGTKGTGKSFILQKLSGLTDNEVPSGEGLPVTAVRCTINNSQENKAHVTFYNEKDFLFHRVNPFCTELDLQAPKSLIEFRKMLLQKMSNSDKETILCKRLKTYQEHCDEFSKYLSGREEIVELSNLRKFVAYSIENADSPGRLQSSYIYLAVSNVTINCIFPRSDVKALQLIDLPGLGELDPTLEARHTEGFQDNVDVCLFVCRPSGRRMDWDEEAQKALDVLTKNCPVSKPSDFVILVVNAGGCKNDNAELMFGEIEKNLGQRYTILRTDNSDSENLSNDILSRTLIHLAKKLPETDSAIYNRLSDRMLAIIEKVRNFTDDARQFLKNRWQGQDTEEIIRNAAKKAKHRFAKLSNETLQKLENNAENYLEMEDVLETIDKIQFELKKYFENGMNEGSKIAWNINVSEKIANDIAPEGVLIEKLNNMRVKIAVSFSSLDSVYTSRVSSIHKIIVDSLNDENVLNGILDKKNPDENIQNFLEYIDNAELPLSRMREAINKILNLKIEHNTQFYPRVYEPIRRLKKAARGVKLDGRAPEEQAESIYRYLVDLGIRTVSDLRRLLVMETNDIFNILYVAYEFFEDSMIRNEEAEDEWIRFFKEYYEDIHPKDHKTNRSYVLNKVLKQINILKSATI